ncbi:hypothetical protein DFH07DRAFT_747002 [Mycena maculata]|uniref:UBL3-like ubiquitin domain-containing protein n=1 Tax=Mycena maculata TaxID=230809 RepID=A0AAD7IUL7_9AGAR|nr:hypothetical protein DFH07DRAFT_747002 [Mycena maculata]
MPDVDEQQLSPPPPDVDQLDVIDTSAAPSIDAPAEPKPQEEPYAQTPLAPITFLLVSGRRRTMSFDPAATIGRVKELVWAAWPADPEWQAERPPAPSYLRVLWLGRVLVDEDTLEKLGFPAHLPAPSPTSTSEPAPPPPAPTIVHLSIRVHAPPADDASKPKKRKSVRRATTGSEDAQAGAEEEGGGCCCVVC